MFLNQARAWFLKIDPVRIVGMRACVCVCARPRLLITSGVVWPDMDLIRLVKKCYMATVVAIVNGRGLGIVRIVDTNPLKVS